MKEEGREGSLAAKKKETTTEAAARLAQPVLEELGLTLWDLRFEKEGSLWYLRYFIDKEEGLTIQDCEAFSRAVDKLLDEADPIPQSYTLEVSSPGIERELTRDWHFEACMGMEITVRFFRPVNGVREFTGTLSGWEDGKVTMLLSGETEMTFALEEASSIRLYNDYTTEDLDIEDDEGE
ncbi:MAG: ribosome maturation factor RimP [Angelakisella sp.]|jgi:ribosome maturation factor RimP|nr:ribosome maturation factor RimP [Angelakisella sp.]